jgi:flagellar basal-body rod modification protein FlgD
MSIASAATQQNVTTGASTSSTPSGTAANNSLANLDSNFSDFLNMLMTQLQNQDPTTPMDANQFTSELVQFSSVEQQIQTNQSLTQLIQLTQGDEVIQGSAIVGKSITVQSTQMALQNGEAAANITAPTAGTVNLAISNSSGVVVYNGQMKAQAGNNTWTWNGTGNAGQTLPDGVYTLVPTMAGSGTASTTLPFTVTGTVTGLQSSGSTVKLQLGALSVPFSAISSLAH